MKSKKRNRSIFFKEIKRNVRFISKIKPIKLFRNKLERQSKLKQSSAVRLRKNSAQDRNSKKSERSERCPFQMSPLREK